nr:hypothetical protein [Tanacetum cinerariifolium]
RSKQERPGEVAENSSGTAGIERPPISVEIVGTPEDETPKKTARDDTCASNDFTEDDMREDKEDVEWVGDKLNEADGKTSTGKNLVPGKPQEIWEDSKTNKKWVTVTHYFFPDDLPERVCHPCAPESNEVKL